MAQRASIVDEEFRQQRERDVSVGRSSGVNTSNGALRFDDIIIESTEMVVGSAKDCVPSVDPAGSEKPAHPLLEWFSAHMCHKFASPDLLLFYFLYIGDNCTLFYWARVNEL